MTVTMSIISSTISGASELGSTCPKHDRPSPYPEGLGGQDVVGLPLGEHHVSLEVLVCGIVFVDQRVSARWREGNERRSGRIDHAGGVANRGPQLAILGVGAIEKRPKVIAGPDGEDTIAIRTCSFFSISFDHRIIDGAVADQFLAHVKREIESFPEQGLGG